MSRDESSMAKKVEVSRATARTVARRARSSLLFVAATGTMSMFGASMATAAVHRTKAERTSRVDITLWESHNGGPVGDAVAALVDRFNKAQHHVKVTVVVTKASSKLLAAIAAGNPPALAEISHYDGQFVKGGALASWNRFLKNSSVVTESKVLPAVWVNGEVNGQHYRLQADLKVSEVFYNESMFKQAGISSPPGTWAELAADTAKLKHLGVIPLGWKDSSAHILPALLSNGGTMLRNSNSVGTSVNFDNGAAQATFSYFRNLYSQKELQFHHGTTLREDLAGGKMAMIDGTSAGYQKVLDAVAGRFKVGAFVEPAGSTGHAANIAQGLGFVMPKSDPLSTQRAAWTFVQWWMEPNQQAFWAEHTGFAPETRAGIKAIPQRFLKTHPGLAVSLAAAKSKYTFPRPVSDSYNEVQASIDSEFFDAVTGATSVSSALGALQSQGNSYMSGASSL